MKIAPALLSLLLVPTLCMGMQILIPHSAIAQEYEKECTLLEPKLLENYIKDKSIFNMFIFDVRSNVPFGEKHIAGSMPGSRKRLEQEFVGKVKELQGKDVVLVGKDSQTAVNICRYMIDEKYGVGRIYILKGGMNAWDGPLTEQYSEIECKVISSKDLLDMMKSGRKVEIIDQRSPEDYIKGRIPGAILESEDNRKDYFKVRFIIQTQNRYNKWAREDIIGIYVDYDGSKSQPFCRSLKWATGYENSYSLEGGMSSWEGPIEKGDD